MDFMLSKEHLAFQKEMREFVEKEVAPGASKRDESEDFEATYQLMIQKMAPRGYLGCSFPKEYGGMGGDQFHYAILMIEICKVDASLGCSASVGLSLGTIPIFKFGTEEQKQKYLRPLLEGKKLSAFGLTEPNAGSDSAMQETTAVRDGNSYILNGKKVFITNAGYADTYIVMAMMDKSLGTKGISAFIVEKDTPGFTFGKQEVKMGIRASIQRELIFEDCRIPKENLIAEEGMGFKIAMTALDVGRIGVAAQGVGVAQGALDAALRYSTERCQFGKPINAYQGISFMLADMAIRAEAARLLAYQVAWLGSNGMPFGKEASIAKVFCTDAAMEVSTNAVQVLGGKGFLRENEVERMMRDSKILQIYEGTNQIQRMIINNNLVRGLAHA